MLGAPDTGTGFHTIAAQLVAEHFGVSVAEVEVAQGDTLVKRFRSRRERPAAHDDDRAGDRGRRRQDEAGSGGARRRAAQLRARRMSGWARTDRFPPRGRRSTCASLMGWAAARGKAPLSCQGENTPGRPNDRTSFVAHFAEVAVDRETGQVRSAPYRHRA